MQQPDFPLWHKMLSGERYNAVDPRLSELLMQTRVLVARFNALPPTEIDAQRALLREILGGCGERVHVNQPFRCDYGCNITVGENFFANFNLTILDEALVTIGRNAFIGPNVSIYTACHPLDPAERNAGVQWAEPVTIGDDVWICGDVTICPGVRIGDGVTIGAGSVVTRDIPAHTLAVGNPARHIKSLGSGTTCR
jgi:acetyltransferase-like isoleucine patch superfamily enzyme